MLIILDFSEHHAELGENKSPEKLNIQNLSAENLIVLGRRKKQNKHPVCMDGEHSSSWS